MNVFSSKIEGCVWTKPGIWKWADKDLLIVCLAQQQPWGAKNISRIVWTMLTLIPITNKDISYNRKIFLRTDSCFEHWALIQCPFDLEKNWYCWIWSRLETNHRNEDGQSAASELICELRRVCEFIRAPLHKSSSWDWDAEVRYISNIRADRENLVVEFLEILNVSFRNEQIANKTEMKLQTPIIFRKWKSLCWVVAVCKHKSSNHWV